MNIPLKEACEETEKLLANTRQSSSADTVPSVLRRKFGKHTLPPKYERGEFHNTVKQAQQFYGNHPVVGYQLVLQVVKSYSPQNQALSHFSLSICANMTDFSASQ